MRKKIFTLLTLALSMFSVQAADLVLNPSETVSFSGWGFSNENAPTLTISNWASGGWNFATPLSQSEYTGVEITLEPTTEDMVNLVIKYSSNAEQLVGIPTGSTVVRADFVLEGDITQIGFSYGNWQDGAPGEANITVVKALVVAEGEGEKVELSFSGLTAGEEEGCTINEEDHSITLTRYSSYAHWTFDPALVSDDYEKIIVTFAEPIPEEGLEIKAETEGDEFSGTTITGLTKGASKAVGYFIYKPGVEIKSIGFYYSWNNKPDDLVTIKIANAVLVKKQGGAGINGINASDIQKEDVFYNLHGQRVNNPTKGIFIKNGKKIVIR